MTRLFRVPGVPGLLLFALLVWLVAAVVLSVDQQLHPDSGVAEVFLLAFTFPLLLMRARLELDGQDPFRLYVGNNSYSLGHATGRVEGASKLGTTEVHGGGGGGRISGSSVYSIGGSVWGGGGGGTIKPITISSTTTIHDQFFLRQPDGEVAAIALKGWDFPVADGHVVSAVWAVKKGAISATYLALRNHTTKGWAIGSGFHILRRNPFLLVGIELLMALLLASGATAAVGDGSVPNNNLLLASGCGGVVGGLLVWNLVIKPRFYSHWARHDVARIREALDAIATAAALTQAVSP